MTRVFARRRARIGIGLDTLSAAAQEIRAGLVDARLGGALIKKRVPIPGRGKRGGSRVIVAYRDGGRLVFLYVFTKNERDNITERERAALTELGSLYLTLSDRDLAHALTAGALSEIDDHV